MGHDQSSASSRAVLANRDFSFYLVGVFFGTLAIQVQSVAVSWQIYAIARSPMALGFAGLAQFLPMVLCVLPAGSLADRYDRRLIIVVSYLMQAAAASMFLALALIHTRALTPWYAVLALFGTARTFASPAAQSLVPQLVPQGQFPQAIAWNSSIFQIAVIVGPALGGAIYILGSAIAYAACLVMFCAVAVVVFTIRSRTPAYAPDAASSPLQRLTAGIRYVGAHPLILGAITLDLFAVLLGGATALLPIYARDILHTGPAGLGLLRSAPAAGAAVVGFILGHVTIQRHAGRKLFGFVAIFGVATMVFGLSRDFKLSLAALAVLGGSDMVSVYIRSTLVQLATPDPMRGRVSAVNRLFIGASNELGEFESGLTASWFGTVPAVVIGGVGTLAVVFFGLMLFPSLRTIDRLSDITPS
jgi:MFS family permease